MNSKKKLLNKKIIKKYYFLNYFTIYNQYIHKKSKKIILLKFTIFGISHLFLLFSFFSISKNLENFLFYSFFPFLKEFIYFPSFKFFKLLFFVSLMLLYKKKILINNKMFNKYNIFKISRFNFIYCCSLKFYFTKRFFS
jgi:hypothetical protein